VGHRAGRVVALGLAAVLLGDEYNARADRAGFAD
jgi:hypothetical protein